MPETQLLTDLRAARAVLAERGLHKGWFVGPGAVETAPLCVQGALHVVLTGQPFPNGDPDEGRVARWNALQLALLSFVVNSGFVGLSAWNDEPERTLDEVLAAFDAAIAAEEERERGEATGDPGGQGPDHG